MIFRDAQHKSLYNNLCGQFKHIDEFHTALLYLIALDEVCRQHIPDIFSIEQDSIKPECIAESWQTGTSRKTCRLAFNLWNGRAADSDSENASPNYAVDEIFNCEYAPYFWQAIKLRFPEYSEI